MNVVVATRYCDAKVYSYVFPSGDSSLNAVDG
jgi:hypothetical protein